MSSEKVQKQRLKKIAAIGGLLASISLLHFATPLNPPFPHELFGRLYYLPVLTAGFWFGLKGGGVTSLLITFLYLPHIWIAWRESGMPWWDQTLELVMLNLAGLTVGFLIDRERRQREITQKYQTLASLGEAAASVAHEMKNIVIPIRGFARRLREVCPPNGRAESYMDILERESGRLENMVRDMLAFSRRTPLQKEEVEIGQFLHEIRENLHEEFREKGVRILCEYEGPGRTRFDRERIRRALVNLLQNALEASPQGSGVRLIARHNGQNLQFVVEDQGKGLSETNLERAFLPFFTTKSHGTGLGLPITQRIVEEHGGEIWVESSPGHGCRFLLEIPITRKTSGAPAFCEIEASRS